ncbi:MAG: hypothetical protein NC099_00515 [Corallococcus sp.]|nr:hypothetical protein [Corallococcus sp.]
MKKTVLFSVVIIFMLALLGALSACSDHDCVFGEWQTVTEPACDAEGVRERYCTVAGCNKKQTGSIAKLPHQLTHVAAVQATCTEDGSIAYGHCSVCNGNYDGNGRALTDGDIVVAASHYLQNVARKEATCLSDGNIAHRCCLVCDKVFNFDDEEITKASTVIPAGHSLSLIHAQEATCFENGNIDHRHCIECGKNFDLQGNEIFNQQVYIIASHSFTRYPEHEASCVSDGNIAYDYCSVCEKYYDLSGKEISRNDTVVLGGHDFEVINESATTSHSTGIVAHRHCKNCGKNYAIGSNAELSNVSIAPTHAQYYDEETLYCNVCNTYYVSTYAQFARFRDSVNGGNSYSGKTVNMGCDIDFANNEWTPINGFRGTFDGHSHTIRNLNVNGGIYVGLFGNQWQCKAVLRDFTIDGANVVGIENVGVVAGMTASTSFQNITVKNAVVKANHWAGGIVGYAYGNITDCVVDGLEMVCVPNASGSEYDNGDKV